MQDTYFFGYGSLVNIATHGFNPVHKATANGWIRAWRYTPRRRVAYLTAVRAPGKSIDGLIAPVPQDGWAALDLREAAYERLPANDHIEHGAGAAEVAIYAIHPDDLHRPDADHPVLMSYLEVVLQGYLRVFGESGVRDFFETTDGWEAPILDDRAKPVYSRAQTLTKDETALVADLLREYGCRVVR
ncbi:gamma-glutamylcyclotransferase family protein [Pacificoceanicola onchidii]|uniref:gamma-glutamylcyclotransferase family protein n=1 Tax=Pacificoceanicola onchidii TaxID=2562685 RepID=UPI0010A6A941|nr:gamma-glutamylcyclotransferase family protein [Pacificoceanicola onchidii]